MKNRKSITSLSAAALLAAILLASCGGDSGTAAETKPVGGDVTETAAVTEPAVYDSVPELDFGGAELRILQQEQPNYYIDEPEATGDVVIDEIVRKNTELEVTARNLKDFFCLEEYAAANNYAYNHADSREQTVFLFEFCCH